MTVPSTLMAPTAALASAPDVMPACAVIGSQSVRNRTLKCRGRWLRCHGSLHARKRAGRAETTGVIHRLQRQHKLAVSSEAVQLQAAHAAFSGL